MEKKIKSTKYTIDDNTHAVCYEAGYKKYYSRHLNVMYLCGSWLYGKPLTELIVFPDLTVDSAESFQFMTVEEMSNELLEIQKYLKSIHYMENNKK